MPASKNGPKSPVTAVDVARRAGVSIATVSRVLHQTVSVSEEVTARVLAAVAELGYVPQAAARNLAQGNDHALGCCYPRSASSSSHPCCGASNRPRGRRGTTC